MPTPQNRLVLISSCRKEPGGEVFVTGSFDDWATPVKLDKVGNGFSKTIDLSFAKGEKIFFKVG